MHAIALDTSALDPAFKNHANRGIGRYVAELARYLRTHQPSDFAVGEFTHRAVMAGPIVNWLLKILPVGVTTIRQQLLFPSKLAQLPFSALHFPAHMDPPAWGRTPYIVTVLDLIPLKLKSLYEPKEIARGLRFKLGRWLELQAMRNAKLILAISECTANDVVEILGIPRSRIVVTPLGVDQKFFDAKLIESEAVLRARYGIPEGRQIVLYVGGIDQRKNISTLLRTHAQLCERVSPRPVLLMAGRIEQDREYPALVALKRELRLEADIVTPGFVADEDLLQLYKISSVFFFPSIYEGFGLPPLEALATGLPVVSSNTSSLPEVLGDHATYIDPSDVAGAVTALVQILETTNPDQVRRAAAIAWVRQFTWERTGETTVAAYRRFLAGEFR